ncbi:MAG TPA: hypothetical protein VGN77_06795 [Steroidobacteraceae bacterium]|nr:hypothetical protein [Steroidobacteraceae bacterium]
MTEPQYFELGLTGSPDGALRDPIAELNLEVLEAYIPTVPGLRGRWHALSAAARARLAACPFLLVDAGFAHPELWARLPSVGVHEALPLRTLLANRSTLSTPLLRRVLLLAWHMARANRTNARIALGMSGLCARAVAGWRLADLEALAERRPAWIRPRWDQHGDFWCAWLTAAASESPQSLERFHLWGLQALAAEVRRQSD